MMKQVLALAFGGLLASCSTVQNAQVASDIQAACAIAMPLAVAAAPVPVVGPFIAAGIQVGCGTAQGLANLAADPSSVAWVNQQIGLLKAGLAAAGINVGG